MEGLSFEDILPDFYDGVKIRSKNEIKRYCNCTNADLYEHLGREYVTDLESLIKSITGNYSSPLREKRILPDVYEGITFKNGLDLINYLSTTRQNINVYASKPEIYDLKGLIEAIKLGRSSRAKEKGIIPYTYNGKVYTSNRDVAELCNTTVERVSRYCKKPEITTFEELISALQKEETPQNKQLSKKRELILPDEYDGKLFKSQEDISKYCNCTGNTVRNHMLKENVTCLSELIESIQSSQKERRLASGVNQFTFDGGGWYPSTIDGVTFTCDSDVAKYLGKSSDTIRKKRYAGYSLKEVLNYNFRGQPRVLKSEFPITLFGVTYTYESFRNMFPEKSEKYLQGRYRHWVVDRSVNMPNFLKLLRGEKVPDSEIKKLENTGKSKSVKGINSSSCFWLCDMVFMPTIKEACSRLGVPYQRVSSASEVGFISAYITTRIKDYEGIVTPELCIEEFLWETDEGKYYRCNKSNEIKYLNEREITTSRLSYIKQDKSVSETVYDGRYFSLKDIANFYGISTVKGTPESNPTFVEDVLSRARSSLNAVKIINGEVIKGNHLSLGLSQNVYRKLIRGEISLEEAKKQSKQNKLAVQKPVDFEEPIFKGKSIVGITTRHFPSQVKALEYYDVSRDKVRSMKGDSFKEKLLNYLINQQENRITFSGLCFSSKEKMVTELVLEKGILKDVDTSSPKLLEAFLLNNYYTNGNVNNFDLSSVIMGRLYIKEFSFHSDSDGLDYFLCREYSDKGKWVGKVYSGYALMQKKINYYKELHRND